MSDSLIALIVVVSAAVIIAIIAAVVDSDKPHENRSMPNAIKNVPMPPARPDPTTKKTPTVSKQFVIAFNDADDTPEVFVNGQRALRVQRIRYKWNTQNADGEHEVKSFYLQIAVDKHVVQTDNGPAIVYESEASHDDDAE